MQIYKDGFIDWILHEDIITDNLDDIRLTNLILYSGEIIRERKLKWTFEVKRWNHEAYIVKHFKQFILIFRYAEKLDIGGFMYELADIFKMDESTVYKINALGLNVDYNMFIKLVKQKKLDRIYSSNGLKARD